MVDKPAFLLIHPSKPDGTPTLWAALRELLAFELVNGGQVSIVNRLDRETSGLVLIAKNAAAARRFGLAMERRLIEKEYLAIVHGWPDWENTIVDAPLARQGAHGPSAIWLKQTIHEKGAPALTEFRVEKRFVRQAPDGKIRSRSCGPFREPGGPTRSASISRISVIRLSATRSTGLTRQLYLRFIETGWTDELAAPAASAAARAPLRAAADRGRIRLAKPAPGGSANVDRSALT